LTTADLVDAASDVVPLAKTKEEEIDKLRKEWAGRAKPATKTDAISPVTIASTARQLDL